MSTEKTYRLIAWEAENIKRISAARIQPNGALTVIGGDNGHGKTSVIDAIEYALRGGKALPEKPVRDGARKGRAVCDLDGIVVERRFGAKTSTLHITGKDAPAGSPQTYLDKLLGQLSFDPLEFTRMAPAAQLELLRDLAGLDLEKFDRDRDTAYDNRTITNREVKRLEGQLSGIQAYPFAPKEEVSVSAIADEIEVGEATQQAVERAGNKVAALGEKATALAAHVAELNKELVELKADCKEAAEQQIETVKQKVEADKEYETAAKAVSPKLAVLREQLRNAETINAQVRDNRQRVAVTKELRNEQEQADKLTTTIENIDDAKRKAIADAKLPVGGLGIDGQMVTYNGIPFAQASSSEQLRVSLAMGLAMNPTLKLILIRDGSLLDEASLKLIAEMAEQADAQVIMERVGKGQEVSVVIEDGEVLEDRTAK